MDSQAGSGEARAAIASRLGFSEHHLSHAASAFYPSPFREAAVLVLDGVGEWATASLFHGEGRDLRLLREIRFPHSLGLLYSAFTAYCGFKVNSGEYKLMGLAPYGKPRYGELIREKLVEIAEDGSFQLNMNFFDYCAELRMTNARFHALFDGPPRKEAEPIAQKQMDIAASIQAVTEEILIKMTRKIAGDLGSRNLCMAGGVALNCVANGKILRDGRFENIWIQPAAGDSGGALGAALVGFHLGAGGERSAPRDSRDTMKGSFLGPEYGDPEIRKELEQCGARFHPLNTQDLLARCAGLLANGMAVGWFQGRMEFEPPLARRSLDSGGPAF